MAPTLVGMIAPLGIELGLNRGRSAQRSQGQPALRIRGAGSARSQACLRDHPRHRSGPGAGRSWGDPAQLTHVVEQLPNTGATLSRGAEELGEAAVGLKVATHLHRVVRLERLGHAIDQRPREAQRVAHLAHGRACPVGDDVADHAGVLGPVALVDVAG